MQFASRKNKDGTTSYFARWYEGGRRRKHTFKGIHDKELAHLAFIEFSAKHQRGLLNLPTSPNLTLKEALDNLLKKAYIGPAHTAALRSRRKILLDDFGSNTSITAITANDINRYIVQNGKHFAHELSMGGLKP